MENDELKEKVEDILAKAKVFAEQASKKAGELAGQLYDAAKKKIEIEKIEYAISKKYKELGKAYYEAKKQSKEFAFDDLCSEISTLFDALDVLNTVECASDEEKSKVNPEN